MKLREHRGGLVESMATVVEIPPTLEAICAEINEKLGFYDMTVSPDQIRVEPYYGYDERTGWDTHIVSIAGYGVYGFTDGPLKVHP